ncbi:MAG: Trk system potassium transporter TrkA [Clostridia bacterium]|nr:Trk system potassium transporter TrkA [Clostridia bacterium]
MKIIIVGCGEVGRALAARLNEASNQITVIDSDPAKVNNLAARLDIMSVVGNGATHAVQQEAGVASADLLIAVTGSDEVNILCCLLARSSGRCSTIARIKNPEYHRDVPYIKEKLGLAMVINPEQAAAEEIARVLRFPNAIKIERFAKGRAELMKFRLPEGSPLAGVQVKDLAAKFGVDVLVCTVERVVNKEEQALIADGEVVIAEKDVISIMATRRNAVDFFRKINYKFRSIRNVMIVGGTKTAHYLTALLRRDGIPVKIIDRDHAVCDELTDIWSGDKGVTVVEGDPSDQEILLEEGVDQADAFVALTGLDEENILLSLFAKSVGHGKVLTKINRIDFNSVVSHLDLESTIYPKYLTADEIERYVRATAAASDSAMETLYHIIPGKVETSEFIVQEESAVTGVPLYKLELRKGVLVAAIIREDQVLIPHGRDEIRAGDRVVIVSNLMNIHALPDILK